MSAGRSGRKAGMGWEKWIVVATVASAAMLQLIDSSIVNVSLSQMMGNLGATLSEIGWVVTSYAAANIVMIALSGWCAQRFGRKRYFVASILIFTAASVACGLSTNVWELVFFRFLQGLGGGGIMTTAQAILVTTFPREELAFAMSIYGLTVVMGPTIGPTLGGWITDNLNWHWIFFVNIPFGIAATALSLSFIPPERERGDSHPMDWWGVAFLVTGVGALQIVLERGQEEGWFDSVQICLLSVVAVVGVVGFLRHELNTRFPVVNLRLFRSRSFSVGVAFCFIQGLGLFSSVFVVPLFAQSMLGFTAMDTGMLMLPGSIATAFAMPLIGKAMGRGLSPRLLVATGFVLFFIFTRMMGNLTALSCGDDFFVPLLVRGFGMGMLSIPITTLSIAELRGANIPQGTSITNMTRQLGGSFGIAIMTTFIQRRSLFHRSVLADHVTAFCDASVARLETYSRLFLSRGAGAWDAHQQGLRLLDGVVTKQAAVLAYLDAFWVVGVFFLVCLPLIVFFKAKDPAVK